MSDDVDELRAELNAKLEEVKELQQDISRLHSEHSGDGGDRQSRGDTQSRRGGEDREPRESVSLSEDIDGEFVVILGFVAVVMIAYMALVM